MKLKTEKFCCFKLETAAIVIGTIQGIVGILGIIFTSIGLYRKDELARYMNQVYNVSANDSSFYLLKDDDYYIKLFTWEVILAIALFFTIVEVVTAALLIYGTIKKCHYSLLPWLITFGCVVFFTLLRSFVYTIVFFVTLFSGDIHMLLMSAFTWLLIVLTTALYCYAWIAMKSLYQNIKAENVYQNCDKLSINC
ncbi:hypothetical protein ACFFRR_008943 [Megaselia abdita]